MSIMKDCGMAVWHDDVIKIINMMYMLLLEHHQNSGRNAAWYLKVGDKPTYVVYSPSKIAYRGIIVALARHRAKLADKS